MDDWRLSEEEVISACEDTTAAKQPSLKYLDRILEKRVSLIKSAPTPEKQARVVQDDQAAWDAVKRIHEALGIAQAAPTPEEKSSYFGFLSAGFEPEAVFAMADAMGKKHPGRYSMDRLEAQMNAMSEKGCLTEAQIRAYIDRQTELERQAERIFSLCDYKNNVNTAATAQMEDWLKLGDLSLIECAAERARGTKLPLQYITKLLREWKKGEHHHRRTGPRRAAESRRRVKEAQRPAIRAARVHRRRDRRHVARPVPL